MFIEPRAGNRHYQKKRGWIEVICGSMFSGKTEELIRRLNRARIARQKVEIFKPAVDTRYHDENVVSHNQTFIRSTPVKLTQDLVQLASACDVIGLDEAQFFDDSLPEICCRLAESGVRIIVAGLDMDYQGKPFGPMPALMATAEFVTKVNAICMVCGEIASHSFRKITSTEQVLLGETESYEARCRHCFQEGMREQAELVRAALGK